MAMAFKMAKIGINISDECKKSFMEMKWKKLYRFIVFKFDESSHHIIVDKVGSADDSYDDLTTSLPNNDCRYVVFDYDFVMDDNIHKSKIFFITWAPEASRIRAKMLYATSKDGLRRAFEGISYEIQATDPTEMSFDIIKNKAK